MSSRPTDLTGRDQMFDLKRREFEWEPVLRTKVMGRETTLTISGLGFGAAYTYRRPIRVVRRGGSSVRMVDFVMVTRLAVLFMAGLVVVMSNRRNR